MTAKTPAEREAWNAYMRAWRRSNPERARAHTKRGVAKFEAAHPLQTQARKRELQRRLVGAVGATSEKRCGPCQVCTLPTAELHWDHDHETGEFRLALSQLQRCAGSLQGLAADFEVRAPVLGAAARKASSLT